MWLHFVLFKADDEAHSRPHPVDTNDEAHRANVDNEDNKNANIDDERQQQNVGERRSKVCFVRKSGTSYGENFDVDIPVTHEVVHASRLCMFEAKAENYDKLVNTLQCGRYKGSDSLQQGRDHLTLATQTEREEEVIGDADKKKVQGKFRAKCFMKEIVQHREKIENIKNASLQYSEKRKRVCSDLTSKDRSFKKKRTDNNVNKIISKIGSHVTPNIYERRRGQTLTPLIQGTIQYSKMKRDHNIDFVREELRTRGLERSFDMRTKWTSLLLLLKENEGNTKYFKSVTPYENFKWHLSHFDTT